MYWYIYIYISFLSMTLWIEMILSYVNDHVTSWNQVKDCHGPMVVIWVSFCSLGADVCLEFGRVQLFLLRYIGKGDGELLDHRHKGQRCVAPTT